MAENVSNVRDVSCRSCGLSTPVNHYHQKCDLILSQGGKLPEGFAVLHLGEGVVWYNSFCLEWMQKPYSEGWKAFPVESFREMIRKATEWLTSPQA